jgi:quercetin dioxygenase-like cupin family protein
MKVHHWDSVEPAKATFGEGVSIRWVINKEHGAPNFAMRVIEIQPGGATPFHEHWNEHEVYVLEGKGALKSPEGDRPIGVGDVAYVAPHEQHQFVNAGPEPLKFICVIPLDEKK